MTDDETDVTFSHADFETIEAAVMETARGRWFLKEFARRNRSADTQVVLEAVDRLKEAILDNHALAHVRSELQEMATAIRQTKGEVRSFPVPDENDPLNALSEAEYQALAEQRIRRMVQTLHDLEGRISALIRQCDAETEQDPSLARAAPPDDGTSAHSHPHPAFLM